MSRWTHAACEECFAIVVPDKEPHRMVEPEEKQCCLCGIITKSGIYIRLDPAVPNFCNHKEE